jgi:hypothetical protein
MSEADPVASKSGFLCTYMSNHPDTLVAYVRYQGKVDKEVESARMSSISTKVDLPKHLWSLNIQKADRILGNDS